MGIINREGALYLATGIDTTGLYAGRREAMGIIKAMASQITSFDVFSGIGISAATAFASAAKSSYDFEKEFQKNMLEVATISAQVDGSMTDFMNRVVSLTQQIPVSAPEAAKALYQIVSAGHDGADGMKILEVSAKSAVGGLTDTATAADAITTVLNAYKLSADEAEKISDQLFTTVRLGKTDFGQLGTSISQVAPIAASYGIGIDEVLSAVASLTKQGTPTAQAMTQIRAAIQGTSKELGDAAFEGRTLQEALQLINDKAAGSTSKMKEMLGTDEGLAATLALTGKNAKSAASDLNELQASAGATEAAFGKMADEAGNQMKLLSNNIHAALRPMGEAILKNVSEAAQMINKGFETGKIESSLESLKKLLIGVAGVYIAYKSSVVGASAAEAFHSAKVTVSNNLKLLQSKITGEAILAKEKERIYQEAYAATLEKTITEEERAKLAKLNLKAGSQEYIKALSDQALQEKKNAESLVDSLSKSIAKNKERLSVAQENLDASRQAVEAAKKEFDAAFEANDLAALEVAQTKMNATAKREEAAAHNVATLSQKVNKQQKQLSIATTNAETAATRVNTATTKADAAAKGLATTATNKLKLASSELWTTMKANPLGAILTLVSLAATAYMVLSDRIGKAETAQSRLNKLNKIATESIANEQAELQLLLSVAKNELVSKEDREKAIKKLNDISPEYLANLSLENINTKAATDSIEAYTKAIEKNAKTKAMNEILTPLYEKQFKYERDLYDLKKKQNDLKINKLGFSDEQLYYANLDISAQLKNKNIEKSEIDKQIRDLLNMYNESLLQEVEKTPIDIPVAIQIESEQKNISTLLEQKEEIEAKINEKKEKGIFVDALDVAQLNAVNEELKKAADMLNVLKQPTNKEDVESGKTVLERKIALTKELSEAEANLKKLRSPSSTASQSEIETAEKNVEDIKKALKVLTGLSEKEGNKLKQTQSDLSRSILDSELKLQSERIAIMKDGKDKRVLLADQEYKETLATIEKEREEYQKKVKEAGVVEDPAVLSTFTTRETTAKDKRNNDVARITKEYSDQMQAIQNEVDSHFRSELDNRLIEIDNYYKEQIKKAKEAGETEEGNFIQMLINKREAEKTYARKESAISTVDFKEQVDLGHLDNKSNDTYFVEETERQKTEILKKYALERITILESMGDEQSRKEAELLKISVEGYNKALSKPSKKSINTLVDEKAIKALQKHFVSLGDSEEEAKKKAENFAETFQGKMQTVSEVTGLLKDAFGGISEELDMALDAIGNIAQGFAEGGLIGGISAAAGQLISVVGNLFTAKREIDKSMVEGYETYMDAINDLIDTQISFLDKLGGMAFGQNVIKTTKDLAKSIAASRTLFSEAMKAGSGVFSHSDGYKANKMLKNFKSQLRDLGIYQTDLNRMTNEQLVSLKQIPELYARLPEGLRKYIDEMSEAMDKTEDFKQQVQDTVLGFDFSEITDLIADTFTDSSIEDALEVFSGNVDKVIAKIVQNMLKRNMLVGPIQKMTEDLYKSMEKKDKNGNTYYKLTADAARDFKENVLGLGKQFDNAWKELEEAFRASGIDLMPKEEENTEDPSDNSLKGAFAKASQESITLLAGQTGAVRVILEDVRSYMQPIREQMQFIYQLQVVGWQDVRAIRELTAKIDKNSEQVAANTELIHEVAARISESSQRTVDALEGTINVKVKM